MNPLNPSSCHIRIRLLQTPLYCEPEPCGCTCLRPLARTDHKPKTRSTHCIIFNLSNGLTTVREAAPAHPPAMEKKPSSIPLSHTCCQQRRTYKVGYYFRGKIGRKQSRQVKCLSLHQRLVIAVGDAGSSGCIGCRWCHDRYSGYCCGDMLGIQA